MYANPLAPIALVIFTLMNPAIAMQSPNEVVLEQPTQLAKEEILIRVSDFIYDLKILYPDLNEFDPQINLLFNELTKGILNAKYIPIFTKEIPESIGQLTHLTQIILNGSQLTTLPKTIGNLGNVWRIELANNPLETLPIEIKKLKKVHYIVLSKTPLGRALGIGALRQKDIQNWDHYTKLPKERAK